MKDLFYIIGFLFIFLSGHSQTREFSVSIPEGQNFTSNYRSVQLLDLRYDTLDNGFILNNRKKSSIVISTSFRKNLDRVLTGISDTTDAKGHLLLVMRKFKLVETNDVDFEYGFCFMRATVFANLNNKYYRLRDLDTLIKLNGPDVTDTLMNDASNNFIDLIESGITIPPADKIEYQYEDILRIESDEKRIIPIYTCTNFTDGVYLSFHSFKNQTPDYTLVKIQFKWNSNARITAKNKEGRIIKLSNNDVFGFVNSGIPYVATDYGTCIIERKNNELFYAGKAKVTNDNSEYEVSLPVAETLGENTLKFLPTVKPPFGIFISKVDYIDGSFMRVKKIK